MMMCVDEQKINKNLIFMRKQYNEWIRNEAT